ncbi:hypothetical protein [Asanoa siamensis]|uniref:Excreted virulence factor EspC (Type VII ESX diderm) n=1 Tax=Asanoa siamensis TaxID=926357 RepID=A0ABQ4CR90_9ACTN|nr:hypothetical protein [Asanoa siamensis]GIF73782.1 hypothetical protein Asi02nite_33000 [Asanoa siamensis]
MATGNAPDFGSALERTKRLQANVDQLRQVSEYVTILAQMVPALQKSFDEANRSSHCGQAGTASALGADSLPEVEAIESRISSTHQAITANLADVGTSLRYTAGAIATIADRFRTAEERIEVSAAQVLRLLPR